jgi:hypothetical protein
MANDHQWWEYVQRVTGRASQSEIARKLGLAPSAVNRWQHTGPKPVNVSEFARAYGRPVTEAMIAAGYMTEADIPSAPSKPKPTALPLLRDEVDEAIWALEALDEELRRSFILQRHARQDLDDAG